MYKADAQSMQESAIPLQHLYSLILDLGSQFRFSSSLRVAPNDSPSGCLAECPAPKP
jgi:hypothetical protein